MNHSLIVKMYAEALGTFLLIFTLEASNGDTFSVCGIIWIIMFITRFVSGALLNPAVTSSIMVKKILMNDLSVKESLEFLYYTIIQFTFGILAGLCAWKLTDDSFFFNFDRKYPEYKAFVCEAFYTGVLCLNALMVGKYENAMYLEGLIICFTVLTGSQTIGHLTKNCLNPVVGVSMNVVNYIANGKSLESLWVYIVSPMTGGITAGLLSHVYNKLRDDNKLYRSSLIFKSKASSVVPINSTPGAKAKYTKLK